MPVLESSKSDTVKVSPFQDNDDIDLELEDVYNSDAPDLDIAFYYDFVLPN